MSSLRTQLVEDSRLAISEDITFAVKSAPSQSTFQPYQATSVSASNITFSVQVPSENIVIDRELYIQADMTLRFTAVMPDADCALAPALVFDYGRTDALQAYPLNALFLTTQCTINNASVSENTQDIMAPLLAMYDKRELNRFNSMTPCQIDQTFGEFADATLTNGSVLANADTQGLDKNFTGRGSFPVSLFGVVHSYVPAGGGPAEVDDSFVALAGSTANTWIWFLRTTSTEPFLALSPWLNLTPEHERAGLMGVNNMAFVLNLDSSCKRVFSTALGKIVDNNLVPKYITTLTLANQNGSPGLDNVRLLLNYLSMSPEQMARLSSPKNVVPYITYPRYISNGTTEVAVLPGATKTLTTQSVQLSMIPDKLIIAVRVPMARQTIAQANAFLAIDSVSITFNNASGLLASATTQDLYSKVSYVNGSGQSWLEFSGKCQSSDPLAPGYSKQVAGLGAVLVLDPVAQFSLPSYLSASSLGQFQLQMSINVRNQFSWSIQPEVIVIAVNSGIFSTIAGSSQIFTGMLTREAVLSAKSAEVKISTDELQRLVGGRMGSAFKRIGGTGYSGGGMSGGAKASRPALARLY